MINYIDTYNCKNKKNGPMSCDSESYTTQLTMIAAVKFKICSCIYTLIDITKICICDICTYIYDKVTYSCKLKITDWIIVKINIYQ